jgi:hypothetical protein
MEGSYSQSMGIFRRRRFEPASLPPGEERSFACAFCGEGIQATRVDPLALNIVEGFQGGCEVDAWPSSTLYAHHRCLLDRLEPELREDMAETWVE